MEENDFFWLLDGSIVWVLFLLTYLQLRNIHSFFFSFEEHFTMFLAQKSVVIIGHTVLYFLDHDCKKTSSWYGESNESSRFLAEGVTGPTRKWWQFATVHGASVSDVIDLVFLWYHRTLLIQLQTLAEVEETILYGFRSSSVMVNCF